MAVEDIGFILFSQLLGMTQYPGAPFTGNIFKDLIMFFLVPTIFIIMVVYMTVGRIFVAEHAKFRVMLGIGMYLFIIAGGYFPAFALLAGPYFIFLIFILGIVYFFMEHFRGRGGAYRAGGGAYQTKSHARGMTPTGRVSYLKGEIARYEANLKHAQDKGSKDEAASLRQQIEEMRDELYDLEHPWEKRR